MTTYIRATEQAKMIRAALKEAFPGFKFDSIKQGSGGGSINISWTDGPTQKDVDAIVQKFSGGYFDGMTDYAGSYTKTFKGQTIGFLADYIFTYREYSEGFIAEVKSMIPDMSTKLRSQMINDYMMMHEDINDIDRQAERFARGTTKVYRTGNPELPVTIAKH